MPRRIGVMQAFRSENAQARGIAAKFLVRWEKFTV
jgi:hypothetical protein